MIATSGAKAVGEGGTGVLRAEAFGGGGASHVGAAMLVGLGVTRSAYSAFLGRSRSPAASNRANCDSSSPSSAGARATLTRAGTGRQLPRQVPSPHTLPPKLRGDTPHRTRRDACATQNLQTANGGRRHVRPPTKNNTLNSCRLLPPPSPGRSGISTQTTGQNGTSCNATHTADRLAKPRTSCSCPPTAHTRDSLAGDYHEPEAAASTDADAAAADAGGVVLLSSEKHAGGADTLFGVLSQEAENRGRGAATVGVGSRPPKTTRARSAPAAGRNGKGSQEGRCLLTAVVRPPKRSKNRFNREGRIGRCFL
eukprot:GHVT01044468.1.p1 GENE.GHVT01044468.1~~GHVT01044468.1.p1  ORF type:complete len:310 (-),score=52.49 GHVT01044468.1:907-1836(-)